MDFFNLFMKTLGRGRVIWLVQEEISLFGDVPHPGPPVPFLFYKCSEKQKKEHLHIWSCDPCELMISAKNLDTWQIYFVAFLFTCFCF